MKDEYKSFYKKDLIQMVNAAAVSVIRDPSECERPECPTAQRLCGIFDLLDEIMMRLDDPEVE